MKMISSSSNHFMYNFANEVNAKIYMKTTIYKPYVTHTYAYAYIISDVNTLDIEVI